MAYIRNIPLESDTHQTSPAYVLTFTRWANRDTLNYKDESEINVRRPLVVINDATQIVVQTAKGNPTPTFSCTLKAGDLNYQTAIAPGDFVIVNMVNWEQKALEIRERALNSKPINKYGDGFKGVFKIIDVRTSIQTDANGLKQYLFSISGKGFDEFNSLIYYNPAIVKDLSEASPLQFMSSLGDVWKDIVVKKETSNVQELVKTAVKVAIGTGTKGAVKGPIPQDRVPRYLMPPQLGRLLNREGSTLYASDINNYYFGIWQPTSGKNENKKPEDGFCSFFKLDEGKNFFKTGDDNLKLQGSRLLAIQDFSNVQVWSLINNYANTTINECYNAYRVAPDGHVYPSLVIRQKPFNNRHYKNNENVTTHTQFLDLPRWKIPPELIVSANFGRSDSARINFVQVFTRSLAIDPQFNQAAQVALGNYVSDDKDIIRSGLKPYIVTCNFDYPESTGKLRNKEWTYLVADWVINGHLKMNGQIQTIGVEEPICIGDNFDFDDTVYQIENVSHMMSISGEGVKSFRTQLSLSMGISSKSSSEIPVYAEMDHTDSYTNRQRDWKKERILPGFSDTQDLPGNDRVKGEEIKETRQASFTNPNSNKKGNK